MMKAYVLEQGELKLKKLPRPKLGDNDVLVTLKVAGLNRRDLYIKGRVGKKPNPLILGSDGAGIIKAVGKNVERVAIGDEVIINPSLRWYKNSDAPPKGFEILGMPDDGTFAEEIVLCAEQVEIKPSFLSWQEAGVLSLAALTGYRALFTKGNLQQGQTVFIPGAGSGVVTFITQFAKAYGARVIVSSRDDKKRQRALDIGADRAIDSNGDWLDELQSETIDV